MRRAPRRVSCGHTGRGGFPASGDGFTASVTRKSSSQRRCPAMSPAVLKRNGGSIGGSDGQVRRVTANSLTYRISRRNSLSASQVFYRPETTNFCFPALGLTHTATHIRLIRLLGIAATPKAAPAHDRPTSRAIPRAPRTARRLSGDPFGAIHPSIAPVLFGIRVRPGAHRSSSWRGASDFSARGVVFPALYL